jgi:hypothetical protein
MIKKRFEFGGHFLNQSKLPFCKTRHQSRRFERKLCEALWCKEAIMAAWQRDFGSFSGAVSSAADHLEARTTQPPYHTVTTALCVCIKTDILCSFVFKLVMIVRCCVGLVVVGWLVWLEKVGSFF